MVEWTWVENWVENSGQLLFWSSLISRWATRKPATARVLVNVFRLYRAVVVADECEAWWRRCSRSAPASEPSVTPPARLSRFIHRQVCRRRAPLRVNFFWNLRPLNGCPVRLSLTTAPTRWSGDTRCSSANASG